MSTLYLCAAGNPEAVRLALALNDAHARWQRIVLLDDDAAKHGREIMGVTVIGPFAALAEHQPGDVAANLVARSTRGRDRARATIESFGIELVSLIHPSVDLRGATLGRAVTIYAGATVSALSRVGDHAIIFTQAVLGHGATLGTGAVLAPGAVVNARVRIGARAYIGANAAVLPDLEVGADATVSACSAALGDVPAGATALGVPAEIMGADPGPAQAQAMAQAMAQAQKQAPEGDFQECLDQIQAIFAQVLAKPAIDRDSSFFDSGGTSKQALALHRLLQQRLGVALSIVDIFRYPSPGQLAAHLRASARESTRPTRAQMRRRQRPARP